MLYANFVIIAYALLALILVILVLSKKGREDDNNLRRMKSIGKDVVKSEYKNIDTSFYDRVIKPITGRFKKDNVSAQKDMSKKTAKQKAQIAQTEKLLRQAGMHMNAGNYRFFKMAFMIVSSLLGLGLSMATFGLTEYFFVFLIAGVLIGVIGPDFVLKSKVSTHQKEIKAQLPDALDLLSVCMEAGLSFDASLLKVSERMDGPFIDELMTVFRQIQMGKSRNEALKSLSDSTDIPELKTFLSSLMQANKLGIPVSNVMKVQSDQLRNTRKQELKEKAAQTPTKMSIPTVVFILPAIFIIILAPTVFSMMSMDVF